jgi:predicted  nucleic acid-binding Zn-ribbon protein
MINSGQFPNIIPFEKNVMNIQLQKLVSLQEIDNEITEIKKMLKVFPEQIAAGLVELEGKKKDFNEISELIDSLQKKRNALEQEVSAENDHMAKTKTKLPHVKTNKEYSAILSEVETIKEKVSKWETEELEILEELDVHEAKIPAIKEAFKIEEGVFAEYKGQKDKEIAQTTKDLESAQARRNELLIEVDSKWATYYQRILEKNDFKAVVTLSGDTCQGCFHLILPQQAIEVRTNEKVETCYHCSRILYSIPESDTETVAQK